MRKTTTAADKPAAEQAVPAPPSPSSDGQEDQHVGLLVLGAGPGGYTAAFRAADLGLEVMVVDARAETWAMVPPRLLCK